MEELKDSGIQWIGKIPKEWSTYHFKYIVDVKIDNRGRTPEILENNIGIPIIELDAIGEKYPNVGKATKYISSEIYKKYIRIDLKENDVLFATVGATIGKSSIIPLGCNYCIAQNVVGYRFNNQQCSLFWYYYFKSEVFRRMYLQFNKSNTIDSIKISDMERGTICIPPLKEQQQIASFLDDKVSKIDDILADLNKQVDILNQYKKSLITETVTKGLNPNLEMKDSGIEWIGKIPKDWNIKIIKNMCKLKGRIGWQGLTTEEYIEEGPYLITGINFEDGTINWDSCEHVSEWRFNQAPEIQIKDNDLLISKDGTVGKVALTSNTPLKTTLNSGVLLIRKLNDDYLEKYLYYVLVSNEFWHWFEYVNIGNTTVIHLYQNIFAKFKVALPPKDQQQQISNYLDDKCSKIDESIKAKKKQIKIIEQYKKSLIYEYVTGKKRVKGDE